MRNAVYYIKPIVHSVLCSLLVSCGDLSDALEKNVREGREINKPSHSDGWDVNFEKHSVEGMLFGEFTVRVDGITYPTSKDFFALELHHLQKKVEEEGYIDWLASTETSLGVHNLSDFMTVFIAPTGDRGHTGVSAVAADGTFRIEIPFGENAEAYRIRAVKRVEVALTKNSQSIVLCYNLTSHQYNLRVDQHVHPIVMNEYTMNLTHYACDSVQNKDITDETENPLGWASFPKFSVNGLE